MRPLPLLILALAASSTFAHADTYQTFALNVYLGNDYAATGTVLLDTTTDMFDAANFTATVGTNTYVFQGEPGTQGAYPNNAGGSLYYSSYSDPAGDRFFLEVPGDTLAGYAGGNVCDQTDTVCGDFGTALVSDDGEEYFAPTGSLTETLEPGSLTATPEPGSLVMLGTGALGLIGAVRRRFKL